MNLIKKIFLYAITTILILISGAIVIFRVAYHWTGFEFRGKYLGPILEFRGKYLDPIIDPLFDTYPVVLYTLAALLIASFLLFKFAEFDIKKDESKNERKIEDDNANDERP